MRPWGRLIQSVVTDRAALKGKLDLVVDINFRMDTSALYSDIVLPSASWYEKDDLNTTDLHSFIHPMGAAVPPCWESAPTGPSSAAWPRNFSALGPCAFPEAISGIVTTPLQHDTPDEIAQSAVRTGSKANASRCPARPCLICMSSSGIM